MAFSVEMEWDGVPVRIRVITVTTFNDAGQIVHLQAHWGPDDIEQR
jgi:hypothetical protein